MGVGDKVTFSIFTKKHKQLKYNTGVQAEIRVKKVKHMITQTTATAGVKVKKGIETETKVQEGRAAEVRVN